jgi:hypothetical protein
MKHTIVRVQCYGSFSCDQHCFFVFHFDMFVVILLLKGYFIKMKI